MIERITVDLGRHRLVTVKAETRYTGTRTGGPGSPNVETYDVVCRGIACEGEWDGDARHDTIVSAPPHELRRILRAERRARRMARRSQA
jgi:hypothetical protein